MFVIARPCGQLANRLVRASHIIAAALEHGHGFADLAFHEYADLFEGTRRDLYCRFSGRASLAAPTPDRRRRIAARADCMLATAQRFCLMGPLLLPVVVPGYETLYRLDGPDFSRLARRGAVLLFDGWLFRTPAVARHVAELRRHFTPVPLHAAHVDTALAVARRDADLLVGVHARRGDYAQFLGGRYFWPLETYVALMRRVLALHTGRRVRFIVCSDEPLPMDVFEGLPVAPGPGHVVEDLYTLAGCDALVGPPSTYTLWASFYGAVPLWMVEQPDEIPTREKFSCRSI